MGNDLRVDRRDGSTVRTSAEAGRYLQNETWWGIASVLVGRSFLVRGGGRTVVLPHLFAAGEYDSGRADDRLATGVGPGVSVRRWFREDASAAPRSCFDLTMQYRVRGSGDARMGGLYANGLVSY